MTVIDPESVMSRLLSRQVLFEMLRTQFHREPKDEAGIKFCDEQLELLEKQIDDVIINGTGDKDKKPLGILDLKGGT